MNCSLLKTMTREAYLLIGLSLLFSACGSNSAPKEKETTVFQQIESRYLLKLDSAIFYLAAISDSIALDQARESFIKARLMVKRVEPIMSFTESESYKTIFQPNILKVVEEDATDIKKLKPKGFQVLEEELFVDSVNWESVNKNTLFLRQRLKLIRTNSIVDDYNDYHFLWLLRNALVRIATTGVTGFDSPVLGQSLKESALIYHELTELMGLYDAKFKDKELQQEWRRELVASQKALATIFDDFDRYEFIKNHTNKQFGLWNRTVADWGVTFPFELAISNTAPNLFDSTTFNVGFFSEKVWAEMSREKIALGRKLFNDSSLSIDGSMSCSTCHQKDIAFTDGLAISAGQTRNSPTLKYAGFQKAFFYDARTGNLEGQIVDVVNNESEFHSSIEGMVEAVKNDSAYLSSFNEVYNDQPEDMSIRNAIAAYVRSLAPFNSRFDESITDKKASLTPEEINGFNLFMGKAQCATCHFPPLFNGTVPPNFAESEMELLGVPEENVAENAKIDNDMGRYNLFQTEERKYFFKTPTVRNVALTAPYMHNGVYNTLDEVMEFYDVGGGAGLGIKLTHQTLPTDPLGLTEEEEGNIIAFMKSLTDQ